MVCGRRSTGGLCPFKRKKDRVPRLPDFTSRGSNTPSVPKGTVADINIYIYIHIIYIYIYIEREREFK